MKNCITHHDACDCIQEKWENLLEVANEVLGNLERFPMAQSKLERAIMGAEKHVYSCEVKNERLEKDTRPNGL